MAFCLKYRSAMVQENIIELKQLVWLKVETVNEGWVKCWRVSVWKISRGFAFR